MGPEDIALGDKSMKKIIDTYSETSLIALNIAWARIFWINRGAIKDNNFDRMRVDFLDARRTICFLVADAILENFLNGYPFEIPEYYFPYLSRISLQEYKDIKAYTIWEGKGETIDDNIERMNRDYLEGCSIIPAKKLMVGREKPHISDKFIKYINTVAEDDKIKLVERKAYWRFCAGFEDHKDNWYKANDYVDNFYSYAKNALIQGHDNVPIDYFEIVFENNHIANMFETCFLIYLKPKVECEK